MTIKLVAITSVNANADSALERYMSVVGPLMQSAGATVVCRYELSDSIVGGSDIQYVSVIDYPDEAAIKMVFESEEYQSLDEVKTQAFFKYQVSIAVTL